MKISVTEFSINYLIERGCADIIVAGIKNLEAENARLQAEIDRLNGLLIIREGKLAEPYKPEQPHA